jgi:hypothetical protein
MLKALALSAIVLAGGQACAYEVWKCKAGDQIRYSDQPCAQGETLQPRNLQGNVVETAGDRAGMPDARYPSGEGPAPRNTETARNWCPSEQDIAGMQTRASSISLSREAKAFMQDEVRRALQCRKGQGSYTAADWAVSRDAQAAQSGIDGGADARRRAEAMHSAADPIEGERIARQREAEMLAEREGQRRKERAY